MSEESIDQAAPLQFLRKPQSKIPWKVFPDTQRAGRWLGKANLPSWTWRKCLPSMESKCVLDCTSKAWPEQQQDYCSCWTTAGISCLDLIHQLRESLASWRCSKGGPPTWAEHCRTCNAWRNCVCSAQRKSNSNIPTPKRCSERRWKQKQA